jgi:hypothetical protein
MTIGILFKFGRSKMQKVIRFGSIISLNLQLNMEMIHFEEKRLGEGIHKSLKNIMKTFCTIDKSFNLYNTCWVLQIVYSASTFHPEFSTRRVKDGRFYRDASSRVGLTIFTR